jgi:hypothetical protein
MKVLYQSQNKLSLQFRPLFKRMMMYVFIFVTILLAFATLVITWDTFGCHRNGALPTQGQCTLTHHNWIAQHQRNWQLDQIKEVRLETEGFQKNGSPRYRIDLHTTTEIIKLPFPDRFPGLLPAIAEEIRQFLADPQQPGFQEQEDGRPYAFFCIALCLAFAGLFGILGQTVTLEISKYSHRLTLRRQNILGTRTVEYPLDEIAEVIVQKKRGGKFGLMGRIAIVLKNDKRIVVHHYDLYYTEAGAYESAASICHFLGL